MTKKQIIGIYPGTFDPVTFGHLDIITRATHFLDRLIISVAENKHKKPFFNLNERIEMIDLSLKSIDSNSCEIKVVGFNNLLVEHAKTCNAQVIVRGLRAVADFEYGMNAKLYPELETLFLMASENLQLTSARFVKEVALHRGDIKPFVPKNVVENFKKKLKDGDNENYL